jgi:hypothetical protein
MEAYVAGVSTHSVDDLVAALGIDSAISKSEVSRICPSLDEVVTAFRTRRLDHTPFPYVYLDASTSQWCRWPSWWQPGQPSCREALLPTLPRCARWLRRSTVSTRRRGGPAATRALRPARGPTTPRGIRHVLTPLVPSVLSGATLSQPAAKPDDSGDPELRTSSARRHGGGRRNATDPLCQDLLPH